ncbi:unnamed protein product [Rotaria socialis]
MTHQDSASLLTLPVELIHMIFDNLSDFTIICSLRQVYTRLNTIMDAYPGYQELDTLFLCDEVVGCDQIKHIVNALRNNPLRQNAIGAVEVQHLTNALKNNTTLTEFHLNANHIGVDGGEHFADALRNNKTLLTLDLAGAGVGDEGAHLLAFALQDNTTLTTLDLGSNNINAEGAQYLADALRNNTTLTTLNLRVNDIGDLGAKYLAGALQNNARLMTLDLALNDMREEAVEHFIVALRENRFDTTVENEHMNYEHVDDKELTEEDVLDLALGNISEESDDSSKEPSSTAQYSTSQTISHENNLGEISVSKIHKN